jgi:DNA-binding PadR family transcriptional regulator
MARRRLPLTWAEPSLFILHSLAASPKHGYAIVKDVEEREGMTLGPGTLYAALSRLEEQGYVEALEGDERRRPYCITALGTEVLEERLLAMSRFAASGLERLGTARLNVGMA